MRRNVPAWLAVAVMLGACDEGASIVQNAPTSAEVGTQYEAKLEMQPKKDGWSFDGCEGENDGFVEADGTVTVFLDKQRPYYLCARLVRPGGAKGEPYRWVVEPTPRKGPTGDELARQKELASLQSKQAERLAKARTALRSLDKLPTECAPATKERSASQRSVWAYPAEALDWSKTDSEDVFVVMRVTELTAGRGVMRPIEATPDALAQVKKVVGERFAVLVAITKDERPVLKEKGYEGGVVEATAYVADLNDGRVLCGTPFRYETPSSVVAKYWDMGGGAAAKARVKKGMVELELARGLHENGAQKLAEALAKLGFTLKRRDQK